MRHGGDTHLEKKQASQTLLHGIFHMGAAAMREIPGTRQRHKRMGLDQKTDME